MGITGVQAGEKWMAFSVKLPHDGAFGGWYLSFILVINSFVYILFCGFF